MKYSAAGTPRLVAVEPRAGRAYTVATGRFCRGMNIRANIFWDCRPVWWLAPSLGENGKLNLPPGRIVARRGEVRASLTGIVRSWASPRAKSGVRNPNRSRSVLHAMRSS